MNRFGFEFSLLKLESLVVMVKGFGEKRKLSVSRPAMSSQELMTSGSDQRDLGSESGEGKMEPKVKRGGGVVGVVAVAVEGGGGGSRVRRP